jgi:predicted component of type VI protein secretion system
MIQLRILSGTQAGTSMVARRFPFQVGRAADADLVLAEPGVWDRHFTIRFEPGDGFIVAPQGEALLTVNGEPTSGIRLRNGDSMEIGAVRLQFWLSDTRQSGLRLREWFVWAGIIAVTITQLVLIYRLLH